jgi:hypothetical protein
LIYLYSNNFPPRIYLEVEKCLFCIIFIFKVILINKFLGFQNNFVSEKGGRKIVAFDNGGRAVRPIRGFGIRIGIAKRRKQN